jgi:hypothetical protein
MWWFDRGGTLVFCVEAGVLDEKLAQAQHKKVLFSYIFSSNGIVSVCVRLSASPSAQAGVSNPVT